jgi:hypothetical protein
LRDAQLAADTIESGRYEGRHFFTEGSAELSSHFIRSAADYNKWKLPFAGGDISAFRIALRGWAQKWNIGQSLFFSDRLVCCGFISTDWQRRHYKCREKKTTQTKHNITPYFDYIKY